MLGMDGSELVFVGLPCRHCIAVEAGLQHRPFKYVSHEAASLALALSPLSTAAIHSEDDEVSAVLFLPQLPPAALPTSLHSIAPQISAI